MRIGPYELPSTVVLAPMAGVTDRPFRILCRSFGAGLAASEMISADARLWSTAKSRRRRDHAGEPEPRVVQLAGADPQGLAEAARANVALGAQIIGWPVHFNGPVYDLLKAKGYIGDDIVMEKRI